MSATKKTNQSNPRALRCVGPADGSFCIGPVTIYVQRVRFVQPPPYPPPLAGEGREGDGRSTRRRNGFAGGGLRQRDWSYGNGSHSKPPYAPNTENRLSSFAFCA